MKFQRLELYILSFSYDKVIISCHGMCKPTTNRNNTLSFINLYPICNNFAEKTEKEMRAKGLLTISPLIVFLGLYVAVSLILGDFYKVPITVALLCASLWAILICRKGSLSNSIESFAREAGNVNVLYMIWIFILAGAFATLADKTGAVAATVAFTLNPLPPQLVAPGLFLAACFISMAIGTSVGTVVALIPLAVNFASNAGGDIPFFVAVVLGGAFFGDNLSFISDTTIAATRTQGCKMNEKFMANIKLVVPAAAVTFLIYLFGEQNFSEVPEITDTNIWLVIPYLTVIILAIAGVNVTMTLISGLIMAVIFAFAEGYDVFAILDFMGQGIDGMGNLIIITLLAAGMLGLIKEAGGIHYLLTILSKKLRGRRGAESTIAGVVGIVNLCTANNTVAILTVGTIARNISEKYGISPRRSASLLDTASCIVQCLIPYGAQTLLAASLAGISVVEPWKYLYYPWVLLGTLILSIIFARKYAL